MNPGAFQVQLFAASAVSPVYWRLLSGNNREAGRGAQPFPSELECRGAIVDLQSTLAYLRPRVRRTLPKGWVWELHGATAPVACSSRPFDRMIRCEQGLAQFLARFADAEINPDVVISGARRWGSVAS